MKAYYFGTMYRAGHYLWEPDLRKSYLYETKKLIPWGLQIDSRDMMPKGINPSNGREDHYYTKHGAERLHILNGWTALVVADNSVDSRPNSKAAFIFNEILTIEKARELSKEIFPSIVARIEAYAAKLASKTPDVKVVQQGE